MLAGVWILVLLPLMLVLTAVPETASLPIPNVLGLPGRLRLDETLLSDMSVYESLIFCVGAALLFSKERGRRRDRFDWTRRWGVICTYVVLLLSAAELLLLCALVLTAIGAVFMALPLKYQPRATPLFVDVGTFYLHYGPYPHDIVVVVTVMFSSMVILLACVPLFNALRSSGPRQFAAILVVPLALFSLIHAGQAFLYSIGIVSTANWTDVWMLGTYFRPYVLVKFAAGALAGYGCMTLAAAVEGYTVRSAGNSLQGGSHERIKNPTGGQGTDSSSIRDGIGPGHSCR
jgi:hypothetical protein